MKGVVSGGLTENLHPRSIFSSPPKLLALTFLLASVLTTLWAFNNFSTPKVLALLLLICGPLVAAIWFAPTPSMSDPRKGISWRVLGYSFLALLVSYFQLNGYLRWEDFFSNFPSHKLDYGGGFNSDSAFHVAQIQNVMSQGYPSAGQHLEPFIGGHFLAYYVDAAVFWIVGLDPWAAYSLLFQAKGAAIVFAIIYVSSRVTRAFGGEVFWPTLIVLLVGITSGWQVVASHTQWLAMMLVLLCSPWLFSIVESKFSRAGVHAQLIALVCVLGLTKISVGFVLALFIGLVMIFRQPTSWRTYLYGAVTSIYFFFRSREYGTEVPPNNLIERFDYALTDTLTSTLALLALSVMIAHFKPAAIESPFRIVAALWMSYFVVWGISLFLLRHPSDVLYFFQAFLFIVVLFGYWAVLTVLVPLPRVSEAVSPKPSLGSRSLALVTTALVVFLPISIQNPVKPHFDPRDVAEHLRELNTASYQWANEELGRSEGYSIYRVARGRDFSQRSLTESYLERFGEALDVAIMEHGVSHGQSLVYLSKENFDELAELFGLERTWDLGILLKAVTGVSLIFAEEAGPVGAYGSMHYGAGPKLSQEDASFEKLCAFGRPVFVLRNVNAPQFDLFCP